MKTQVNKFLVRFLETLVEKGAVVADRVAALQLCLTRYEAVSRDGLQTEEQTFLRQLELSLKCNTASC